MDLGYGSSVYRSSSSDSSAGLVWGVIIMSIIAVISIVIFAAEASKDGEKPSKKTKNAQALAETDTTPAADDTSSSSSSGKLSTKAKVMLGLMIVFSVVAISLGIALAVRRHKKKL